MTTAEKRAIGGALAVVGATLLLWGATFVSAHITFAPKDGGEYSEAMVGQPKYINPLFAGTNDIDADITALTYSGLFRYDKEQKFTPDLAESYKISDDKKIYTVKLRQDAHWSDGEAFTADDVVFTFETVQNPEVGSPLYPAFQGVKVEKNGDYEVAFVLKEPFAPFLSSLTAGILPEHIWADIPATSMKLAKNNIQPVGTGPWKFSKFIKDETGNIQTYALARNENYYGVKPHFKTITFKFFNDAPQAIEAVRSQTVSAISFVPRALSEKIISKNLLAYKLRLPQYTALFFNQNQQTDLKTADVRTALALSLDKKEILKEGMGDNGDVIDAPILEGSIGYYPDIKKLAFDAAKANELLDKIWPRIQPEEYFSLRQTALKKNYEAELTALKKNASTTPEQITEFEKRMEDETAQTVRAEMNAEQMFYRQDKNKRVLALTITTADTPEYARTAERVAKMWRVVGVKTDVRTLPARQISREAIKDRDYGVLLYGEIVGSDPDLYPFWHSSQTEYPGLNLSMFVDRAADKLLEDARGTTDNAKRTEAYKKFQDILVKEIPAIFLYTPTYTFVANKDIKGITVKNIYSPADRYNDLPNWYVKTKWQWK